MVPVVLSGDFNGPPFFPGCAYRTLMADRRKVRVCDEEMGRKEEIRRERWEGERERERMGLRWVGRMWADEGKGEETGGETGREEIEGRKGERAEQ